MEALDAYDHTSSESGDSEGAGLNENSTGEESSAIGEMDGEEEDGDEMGADESAGDESRPVAGQTTRPSEDAMMARLDRLANEFKDTVNALKYGNDMARRISPVKQPRRASLDSEQLDDLGGYKVNKVSIASLTYLFPSCFARI